MENAGSNNEKLRKTLHFVNNDDDEATVINSQLINPPVDTRTDIITKYKQR